ncbi:MAG: tetratricopeptide repeat protein [Lachnospiraceae bacterium]|nr:tetratricopeptide repeat protein [Lachnospiraceae bacterium]
MTAEELIYKAANVSYNEGLSLARLHDLSGAIVALSRALKYNKRHTDARNLLGLVYFEYGEPVLALREWVISKNFQHNDNAADHYLREVQRAGTLDKLDSAAKKFNLGLDYAKSGNLELARIQLKRVLSGNPKMVRARLLLALLHMQDGKFSEARKELRLAQKIDVNNSTLVGYMQEVETHIAEIEKEKKRKRRNHPDVIDITDGNDSWRMPRQTFVEAIDNTKSGILNLILGTGIGIMVAIFLIVPTVKQEANADAATALISANTKAQTTQNDVEDLSKEVKRLNKRLEKYEGQADIKESYELLVDARNAYDEGEFDTALSKLDSLNKDLLEKKGVSLYEKMEADIQADRAKAFFSEGMAAKKRGDYETATKLLKSVVKYDENYADGEAMYRLAESYEKDGKVDRALTYYKKVAEEYPTKYIGRKSAQKVDALDTEEEMETVDTQTDEMLTDEQLIDEPLFDENEEDETETDQNE